MQATAQHLTKAILAVIACTAAACGDDNRQPPAPAPHGPVTSRSRLGVAACLKPKGFKVTSARVPHPSSHEPDAALTLERGRDAAEVAFYERTRHAKRLEPDLRANARRIRGVAYRRHRATIVWFRPPTEKGRRAVDDCLVEPPSDSD